MLFSLTIGAAVVSHHWYGCDGRPCRTTRFIDLRTLDRQVRELLARISSAVLVFDSLTSSANGAFGRMSGMTEQGEACNGCTGIGSR
jgi:hypothetical protein